MIANKERFKQLTGKEAVAKRSDVDRIVGAIQRLSDSFDDAKVPIINVPVPSVTVESPEVTVEAAAPAPRKELAYFKIERDKDGLMTRVVPVYK